MSFSINVLLYCLSHNTTNFNRITHTHTSDITSIHHKTDHLIHRGWGQTVQINQPTHGQSYIPPHIAHSCQPTSKLHYCMHLAHQTSMPTKHSPTTAALLPLPTSRPIVCCLLALWCWQYRPTSLLLHNQRNTHERLHNFAVSPLLSRWPPIPHWKFEYRLSHVETDDQFHNQSPGNWWLSHTFINN